MTKLAELLGFLLLVAFLAAVWPPLALLGAGLLLVAWANTRPATASRRRHLGAVFTAALDAGRERWSADVDPAEHGPTRRIRPA